LLSAAEAGLAGFLDWPPGGGLAAAADDGIFWSNTDLAAEATDRRRFNVACETSLVAGLASDAGLTFTG